MPQRNIVFEEHFCFKYFSHSKGSPFTLVPEIMKGVFCKTYSKYYKDLRYKNVKKRLHLTCIYCQHIEDEGLTDLMIKNAIPQWYIKEIYKATSNKVNNFTFFRLILLFYVG